MLVPVIDRDPRMVDVQDVVMYAVMLQYTSSRSKRSPTLLFRNVELLSASSLYRPKRKLSFLPDFWFQPFASRHHHMLSSLARTTTPGL